MISIAVFPTEALFDAIDRIHRSTFGERLFNLPTSESLFYEHLRNAPFAIFELLRHDLDGHCHHSSKPLIDVQGVRLAEVRGAHPFLIVSHFGVAESLECPGYWDLSSKDSLSRRMKSIILDGVSPTRNFDRLIRFTECILNRQV